MNSYDVIIVGGGCAGLSALSTLANYRTLLIEKNSSLGGRVKSINLEDSSAELGALYSLEPMLQFNSISQTACLDNTNGNAQHSSILFIISHSLQFESFSPIEAFDRLAIANQSPQSTSFYKRVIKTDSRSEPIITNPNFGRLDLLSPDQLSLVGSLFQVTHPGSIYDCIPSLRPLCLNNFPSLTRTQTNQSVLMNLFRVPSNAQVALSSNIISLTELNSSVEVKFENNDKCISAQAKSVIVTPPPASIFPFIKSIRSQSLNFYHSAPYISGYSFVFLFIGPIPAQSAFVSSIHIWSVCFFTRVDDSRFIVNCYVPSTRFGQFLAKPSEHELASSLKPYLSDSCLLLQSRSKFWRYLAPVLSDLLVDRYFQEHFVLSNRIFYGGELSTFTPDNLNAYGTHNAIKAGEIVANFTIDTISSSHRFNNFRPLPPLLNAHVFTFNQQIPKFLGSQPEGNVAFYGLLLSAFKEQSIKSYLLKASVEGLWEYNHGFGVTLEDSLLVLEGLIDNGLPKHHIKRILNLCIDKFYDTTTGLFVTVKKGRSSYWQGPSIHGTAQISYLILKHFNLSDSLLDSQKILDFLSASVTSDSLWKSRWFTNSYFTSFYVVRLLMFLPDDHTTYLLLSRYYERILQSQVSNGSWEDSPISTSSVILTLVLYRNSLPITLSKEIKNSLIKAINYLRQFQGQECFPSEPLLYYWYDISEIDDQFNKRFYHCMDKGRISAALASLALQSASSYIVDK